MLPQSRKIGTRQMLPAGSLTRYPIAELRNPSSRFIEEPVLFTRYSQISQDIPDPNYPPDIIKWFIDSCENIEDPKDQGNGTNNNHGSNNDPNNILILLTCKNRILPPA
jgi:hypothetical protein